MDSLCFPWRRIPPPAFPSAFQAGRNRARTNTGAERAGARRCFTLEHLKLCILPVSVCVCVWSPAALAFRGEGVKPGYRNVYVRHFC